MHKYKQIILKYKDKITSDKTILFFLILISTSALLFYFRNWSNLGYADSMSRLDIARKVVDNLNPGFAQFGNVWLPLPQIIMLPFISNNYLWHSGLAGSFPNMVFYILSGYFIFKSAFLISKSKSASILALSIFALNINILYLQTTAMSESLFLCTVAASIYFLLLWTETNNRMYLIPAALAVSAMTYTRYEGLAVLFSAIPIIFLYSWIRDRKYARAEGNIILFSTLACLGFALWTGYLFVIFNDPLFWVHYYATPAATGGGGGAAIFSQHKSYMAAVWQYTTSMVWMVGLIPVAIAALSVPIMLYRGIRDKKTHIIALIIPLSLFAFMVLTLKRNTPIVQPALTWVNILSGKTSLGVGFNIRYGMLLLPWVAVMSVYLFSLIRRWWFKALVFGVFAIQIFSYVHPTYSIIFQIPAINYGRPTYGKPYSSLVDWFKTNYDGGLIMISASSHEDQMFLMDIDYKNFIHEGAGKYWKESLDEPAKYATYVVFDPGHPEDQIFKNANKGSLDRNFIKIADVDQVVIYKNKTTPWALQHAAKQ